MIKIPFVGGAYCGRIKNLNSQECQNWFPIMDKQGGKEISALMGTPGLTAISLPYAAEVRGIIAFDTYLYAVIGIYVYKVESDGDSTVMGGTLSTSTGKVWMEHNGTQVLICDGQQLYCLTGTTVALVTDADLPLVSSLTYQDGYFIVSEKDSGQFYISASYDGTDWDALDYATAEGDPDDLSCVVSCRRELWLLGKRSYEVWYNSGNSSFPFERILGTNNQIGCIAPGSAASGFGYIAWLSSDLTVRASMTGYQAQMISTDQINYHLGSYTTVDDAIGFIYSQEGHIFYQLTFPTEGKTWVFDFTTGYWHTRSSGRDGGRHRANCCAMLDGIPYIGDYTNGKIYYYDFSSYDDDGAEIVAIRTAQSINNSREMVCHHSLEIEFEAGVGLATDDIDVGSGSDPQAMLQWSDDGGHTWSNEHWKSMGLTGKYKDRVIWRALGSSRDRVYRVMVSDPVKRNIISAAIEAS